LGRRESRKFYNNYFSQRKKNFAAVPDGFVRYVIIGGKFEAAFIKNIEQENSK
jgi:hypothetical protein